MKKFIQNIHLQAYPVIHYFLMMIVCLIPLQKKWVPLVIVLALIWTLIIAIKHRFRNIAFINASPFLSILFFLFLLLGMSYTQNSKVGWFDIQVKLSFFVFPLIFILQPVSILKRINKEAILRTFALASILHSFISIAHSIAMINKLGFSPDRFIYTELSLNLHPSYFSLYLTIAFFVFFEWMTKSWKTASLFFKVLFGTILLYLLIFILFLNSKAGILVMFLMLVPYVLIRIFQYKRYLLGLLLLGLSALSIIIIYQKVPSVSSRLSYFIHSIKSYNKENKNALDSTGERILIWQNAGSVVRNTAPWGAGTGDGKDLLIEEYKKNGFEYGVQRGFNCHNQYLQTLISIGIPGLILLLSIFLSLLFWGIRHKNTIAILFTIAVLLHFSVESMLERQEGVVFIAFFASLLGLACLKNPHQCKSDTPKS